MKRAALLMTVLLLAGVGCSSKKPNAATSPRASATSSATASARASAKASTSSSRSTSGSGSSTTSAAPSTGSTGSSSSAVLPPAPGIYHYTQSGSTQASFFSFTADPTGTLAIGSAMIAGSAKRQKQTRTYSSSWSQDQTFLYGSDAIRLEQTTMRFGSGGYVQEQTCKPDHPLKAIALPFRVGKNWSDAGTCNGLHVTLSGTVLKTETRSVGGRSVSTYVLNVKTHTTGDGYDIATDLTTWISPAYRLVVRSVQKSSGTAQGSSFTQNLTEDLKSVKPDA